MADEFPRLPEPESSDDTPTSSLSAYIAQHLQKNKAQASGEISSDKDSSAISPDVPVFKSDTPHPRSAGRPDSDIPVLKDIAERLAYWEATS